MEDTWDVQEAEGLLHTEKRPIKRKQARWPLYAVVYLFVLLLTNFVTALAISRFYSNQTNSISRMPDRPLYEDLDRTSLHPVNFSAFTTGHSQYTAPASTDVDEAWRALGVEYFAFLVPIDQAPAFDISDDHVIVPADAPGARGTPGYVANVDGIHQLHCLNLLRKALFFNYPYYSSPEHQEHAGIRHGEFGVFNDSPPDLLGHINHCVDALRERILCASDSEVLPYYWWDMQGLTIPDFAVTRQCRDFESLRSWAENHQLEDWGWTYRLTTPEDAYLFSDPSEL